jgi:hypothetical protein
MIGCIGTVLSGWFLIDWLRALFDAVARVDPSARFELISRDAPEAILSALQPAPTWAYRLSVQAASPAEMPAIVKRHTASVMFITGGLGKLGSSPSRMAEVLATGASSAEMDTCVAELLALMRDPLLAGRCRCTAEALFFS